MRVRLSFILALLFCHFLTYSQSTILRSVAGTGVSGHTGDGGLSMLANIDSPENITFDRHGNMYFADPDRNVVRRISTAGIITTVAGNGTSGSTGDGGPATAASMHRPRAIAIDALDNIYIADWYDHRVRKVDAAGTITTVAGNGGYSASGDGGPATAAEIGHPTSVAIDADGNIYIAAGNRVRKVNTAGIISTFAGGGVGGDGGPATAASINPTSVLVSNTGDILIGEYTRIRSVNAAGIISTIAGTSTAGFSGDNGPATAARFWVILNMHMNATGDLYVNDSYNGRIRKIDALTGKVVTIAGNNSGSVAGGGFAITALIRSIGITTDTNGTVYIGNPIAHRIQKLDKMASVSFYLDANSNCAFDATEYLIKLPTVVAVDSNGITIDTLCTTGGIDYCPRGNTGDIYAYRIVSPPSGLMFTCPASGVVYDTIHSANNHFFTAQIGLECSSSLFDLSINSARASARPWMQQGHIYMGNSSCAPEDATVTATFSNNFTTHVSSFHPAPSAVTPNSVSWHFPGVGSMSPYWPHMYYYIGNNPALPMPAMGDVYTVQVTVTPSTGDGNPVNNQMIIVDTTLASHDPNDITPSPAGCITQGTRLEYTIRFENTGSDTAFNIFVMDTLPATLDPRSMRILHASHTMNVARLYLGDRTIVKFDFPNINLPDTSHHGLASGTFTYSIMPRYPLPPATTIENRVGIYFDYNPVVLTNTAWNMVDCPTSVADISRNNSEITTYPNPAEGKLTIRYGGVYDRLTITDMTGRQVAQMPVQPSETTIDVAALPAGLYYVVLRGQAGIATAKFTKL